MSKFQQILATKQVPTEDVEGILEGGSSEHLITFSEYRKLQVAQSESNSEDGSEEQIHYKGRSNL